MLYSQPKKKGHPNDLYVLFKFDSSSPKWWVFIITIFVLHSGLVDVCSCSTRSFPTIGLDGQGICVQIGVHKLHKGTSYVLS